MSSKELNTRASNLSNSEARKVKINCKIDNVMKEVSKINKEGMQ